METCALFIKRNVFSKNCHLGNPVESQNWSKSRVPLALRLEGAKARRRETVPNALHGAGGPEGPMVQRCNGAKARRLEGPQAREWPKAGNCTKQSWESLRARNRTKQAPGHGAKARMPQGAKRNHPIKTLRLLGQVFIQIGMRALCGRKVL